MKEFSSKSYLKDIKNYELKIYINKENYYITIKKVNNIKLKLSTKSRHKK